MGRTSDDVGLGSCTDRGFVYDDMSPRYVPDASSHRPVHCPSSTSSPRNNLPVPLCINVAGSSLEFFVRTLVPGSSLLKVEP